MTLTLEQLLVLFTALVSLFSPLANIGPFTALVGHFSREDQRKIARGVFVSCVIVTLIFVWGGELLFDLLGVNPDSLTVTGGIALFLAGMPMMLTGAKEPESKEEAIEEAKGGKQGWRSMVAVPMTFPMSIDATDGAYIVSATAIAQNTVDLLAISGAVLLFCIVVWLTHHFSPLIGRAVGPGGRDILTRVGGIVLVAIAVQLLASGLKGLFPALGG